MPEIFLPLLVLLVMFLLPLTLCGAFGYTILQPMALAIHGKKLPTRFYVSDFFSLTFLIAIPLVFVTNLAQWQGGDTSIFNAASFVLVSMGVYVWWRGTAFLSGIGVLHAGRRCLFLGILLPIALVGSAIGVPTIIIKLVDSGRMNEMEFGLWLLSIVAMPIIAYGCRQATYWVLSDPHIPKNEASPKAESK